MLQIAGIARQLLAPLTTNPSSNSADDPAAALGGGSASSANESLGSRASTRFHELLSRYDVRNISPRDFSRMVQELRDAGEIDDETFRDLTAVRVELDRAGKPADESLDLVHFLGNRLRDARTEIEVTQQASPDDAAAIKSAKMDAALAAAQLGWVNKFALVQASGAEAIDADA